MRVGRWKIVFLVTCCAVLVFELWHFRRTPSSTLQPSSSVSEKDKPDFALLPASDVAGLARFFAGPEPRLANWEPTVGDMNDAEANLSQIPALSSKDPDPGRHIDNPRQYFRQYGAVVINGRRVLLLNALCSVRGHENDWRKHLIVVMDGGKCYWHALYDPSTGQFSDLTINGMA